MGFGNEDEKEGIEGKWCRLMQVVRTIRRFEVEILAGMRVYRDARLEV